MPRILDFSTSFSSSKSDVISFPTFTLINVEHKTGFIITATKREDESVTMSVFGRKPMNSPAIPGININGKNAATVVIVEVVTGMAISFVPKIAASIRFFPACL